MYGQIKIVYRDDQEKTYDTYISHLVKYEQQFGSFEESITAAARVGWIVSVSTLPFDTWIASVKYVEPIADLTDLGEAPATDGAAPEAVPTP